jgi:hypothetical protein
MLALNLETSDYFQLCCFFPLKISRFKLKSEAAGENSWVAGKNSPFLTLAS